MRRIHTLRALNLKETEMNYIQRNKEWGKRTQNQVRRKTLGQSGLREGKRSENKQNTRKYLKVFYVKNKLA